MANSEDSKKLCSVCGLCCNGIVVDTVRIDDTDRHKKRFNIKSIKLSDGSTPSVFFLPCPYHSGHHCKIYNDTPDICKKWLCKLLKRFESGNIDFNDAVSKINLVKDLAVQIDSFLKKHEKESTGLSWRKRVSNLYKMKYPNLDESGYKNHSAEFLLNVAAIDVYTYKYFVPEKKEKENIFQTVQF